MKNCMMLMAALALFILPGCGPVMHPPPGIPIAAGDLLGAVRGNVRAEQRSAVLDVTVSDLPLVPRKEVDYLSGVVVLCDQHEGANAWDDQRRTRQAVGLNYEHIISTYPDARNDKSPRRGYYPATLNADGSVTLTRARADEPWGVSSTLTYTAVAPHYIDFEFTATVHDASQFGTARVAAFFFASYMRGVEDVNIHFRGIPSAEAPEQLVTSPSAPVSRTMIAVAAHSDGQNSSLPSVEWPRIAQPYYYGVAGGMVYGVMFDSLWTTTREVRFTVVTMKDGGHHPAWDFSLVARELVDGSVVHLRGRMLWKPFVSPEDIAAEYASWRVAVRD